jgi:hypothetical protein
MNTMNDEQLLNASVPAYAIMHGGIRGCYDEPADVLVHNLLSVLCYIKSGCCVHRGCDTASPISGVGYGILNKCKTYKSAPGFTILDQHPLAYISTSRAVVGLQANGLGIGSPSIDVQQKLYTVVNPCPFLSCVSLPVMSVELDELRPAGVGLIGGMRYEERAEEVTESIPYA